MKKILCIIGICIVMIGMPLATALSASNIHSSKTIVKNIEKEYSTVTQTEPSSPTEEPPSWANGNFTGVWGFDIWGEYQLPVGWMYGYYKHNTNFGYFYAAFANYGSENISWFIQGYFFGPFMFGSLGENKSANSTIFVGIGRYNETNYHWRIMGETGPTFFMDGTYIRFD